MRRTAWSARPLVRGFLGAALVAALAAEPGDAEAFVWPNTAERIERELTADDPTLRRQAAIRVLELPDAIASRLTEKALADDDEQVRLAAAQAAMRLRLPDAGQRVVPWLNDADRRIRLAAAELLRASPTERGVAPLARVLGDPDAEVRRAAAVALGASGSEQAVMPLLGHLDDTSPDVRRATIQALATLGDDRAVVPLIGKIQDSRATVREEVARTLGELGSQRAVSALVLALEDDVVDVKMAALGALGRLADESSVLAIVSLLADEPRSEVRAAALEALAHIPSEAGLTELVAMLEAPEADDLRAAVEALAEVGDRAVPRLRECLAGQPTPRRAGGCTRALAKIGPPEAAEAIRGALRRGIVEPTVALEAFGALGDAVVLPAVLELLFDPDPFVRREAIETAAKLLDPQQSDGRAVEPIARALDGARAMPRERAALARLLGRTGSPRAVATLRPLARADDTLLRSAALEALGRLGPAGQDEVLLEALDADEPEVRLAAAIALRRSAAASSADPLLGRFSRVAEQDRGAVTIALGGALAAREDANVLRRTVDLLAATRGADRDGLIEAVGRMPGAGAGGALARLVESTAMVADRAKAAEALAGHPSAVSVLVSLAGAPEGSVRANAVWALGSAGTTAHLPLLDSALADTDVAVAGNAVAAMGLLGARHATDVKPRLCAALDDRRGYVRANALGALAVTRSRCGDGARARTMLLGDEAEVARRAAARLLHAAPSAASDADRRALSRCAASDPSGAVAVTCQGPASAALPGVEPVSVYVVPMGETSPVPRAPFALLRADGLMRLGVTDRRGAVFEHAAPRGSVRLEVPAPLAR